ncbi:MAG: hypothetical protein HYZ00_08695 [Candidatus Hydrogenedentes bacterium]|nr:hypothetical protein [Candidatus Hydrogenedentota bacterium]
MVHGRIIELEGDAGLPDGQAVRVTVYPLPQGGAYAPGEGLKRSFGAWAEDAEAVNQYLEWNRRQRKMGRPEMDA